jgi:hypothetical protein
MPQDTLTTVASPIPHNSSGPYIAWRSVSPNSEVAITDARRLKLRKYGRPKLHGAVTNLHESLDQKKVNTKIKDEENVIIP